jgi:phosphatidylserine/phosphatidylglycerophosphate/cardiolipin synthase-like enzyme
MVIDQSTVNTGSFNFTRVAEEKNALNLLIIKSRELAGIYIGNGHWQSNTETLLERRSLPFIFWLF